jgi:UDP-N-acetyl-D-glucosamine dehydrogenase
VPLIQFGNRGLKAVSEQEAANSDCVVMVSDHTAFDYAALVERANLIVDSRNVLKKFQLPDIVRL